MTYTDEQLQSWKSNHGNIFEITIDDYSCILREPSRKDLSYISAGGSDPMKMSGLLFDQLWLVGDEIIREKGVYFLAALSKMDEIIKMKEVEIKKL